MSLFHRHAAPQWPRIAITSPDPADEVRRLRGLIEDLGSVICTLAEEVLQLRCRFADVRGTTAGPGEPLHPAGPVPDTTGDPVVDAARLGSVFDLLHDHADALWFERQWLAAQIDAALDTPGHGDDTAPAGR